MRITDEDLARFERRIGQEFDNEATLTGDEMRAVIAELRERREPVVFKVGDCEYGALTLRALAIAALARDVDTAHDGWCQTEREILARGVLAVLDRLLSGGGK